MKCRAMPKYLTFKDITNKELSFIKNKKELYFNSGRSALAFLLKNLNLKNIALQPFNCKAVLEAIKTANYKPIFLDIKLTDFSLDFKELINCKTRIDVLLITHYQGIPNIQYKEIINYCKEKNIIVIDDMAQTYGSSIRGIKIGELANYSIYSFAIDKPFTSFEGGALILKEYDNNLWEEYMNIKIESKVKEKNDFKRLLFYIKYYSETLYFENLNNYRKIWEILITFLPEIRTYQLLKNQLFCKVFLIILHKLFKFDKLKPIRRLGMKKIELIYLQKKNFKSRNFHSHLEFIKKYDIKIPPEIHNKETIIYWNRISVLDSNGKLQKKLKENNIEVGNFNWPLTLSNMYSQNGFNQSTKKNSEYASKNILNIPCW